MTSVKYVKKKGERCVVPCHLVSNYAEETCYVIHDTHEKRENELIKRI